MPFKWENTKGHILYQTNISEAILARDDTGCSSMVLEANLYLTFGEPPTEIHLGHGFGYRVKHLKLMPEVLEENKYFFKLVGVEMEWVPFIRLFWAQEDNQEQRDLARKTTFGWRPIIQVGDDGEMGFVQKGAQKFAVKSSDDMIQLAKLWKSK